MTQSSTVDALRQIRCLAGDQFGTATSVWETLRQIKDIADAALGPKGNGIQGPPDPGNEYEPGQLVMLKPDQSVIYDPLDKTKPPAME